MIMRLLLIFVTSSFTYSPLNSKFPRLPNCKSPQAIPQKTLETSYPFDGPSNDARLAQSLDVVRPFEGTEGRHNGQTASLLSVRDVLLSHLQKRKKGLKSCILRR